MGAFGNDRYAGTGGSPVTGLSVVRLRERAAQCYDSARRALSEDIAAELKLLAQDYERDALRLETAGPT